MNSSFKKNIQICRSDDLNLQGFRSVWLSQCRDHEFAVTCCTEFSPNQNRADQEMQRSSCATLRNRWLKSQEKQKWKNPKSIGKYGHFKFGWGKSTHNAPIQS
jgi:hypothetical protein